jgi:hypothetical protein
METAREKLQMTLKTFRFHGDGVPYYMHSHIVNYVLEGESPGHFLTAVLENDLIKAVSYADDTNISLLHVYACFFYNHIPSHTWGSPEKVKRHMEYLNEIK